MLAPGQAIFSRTESEYLLREDPNFTGSSLHYALLRAVAAGATSPAQIGATIERERSAFARPLEALVGAGYIRHGTDPLWKRRPVITLVDQLDVITLVGQTISLVGEAKATIGPVGRPELDRLDRVAAVLTGQRREATHATRALFSMHGFRDDLVQVATERGDVLLVHLPAMLGAAGPVVVPTRTPPGRRS